jgi:genome maintenance exonuclease 1
MIFERTKVPGLQFELPVVTRPGSRFYVTPAGNKYPSASSVAGLLTRDGITAWRARVGTEEADRKSKRGADRGTTVHAVCERYLDGTLTTLQKLGMMPTIKEMFLSLQDKFDEHISVVYAIEQPLYSDRLKIAGRCDAVVLWNKMLAILDVKTANRHKPDEWILNYFVQTSAYAEMFEERTGMPVDRIVLATAIEGETHAVIHNKSKVEYLPILHKCIDQYYKENGSEFV